jgi:hypothetical protein
MGRFSRTTRLRTARFPSVGTTIEGVVTSIVDVAVPDFVDGRIVGPKFDVSGTVQMQADVTVIDTDGEETVIHTGTGIAIAIAAALKAAKATDLHPGDTLTVSYVADEDAEDGFATKVYDAVVVPAKSAK